MPAVSQVIAPNTRKAPNLFKLTEYQKLSGIFNTLLKEVRESVIDAKRPKTKVQILGDKFSVSNKAEDRDTGRSLVRPVDLSAPVEPPTKLVLTNTKRDRCITILF